MDAAAADLEETKALELESRDLERAITSLLHAHDPDANAWITNFATLPRAWSVSLYLAFPPPGSSAGVSPDVRFFALNLLLSKIRSDKSQVTPEEAQEIYEALINQLPHNLNDRQVGARLCLVVSGAAALAGADTCYELVEFITNGGADPALSVELLISLAEETLHRITALPWQVGECMQECSPQVVEYLQKTSPITSRVIVCLERWIRSGVVLSEFYSQNASFLTAILEALASPDEATFDAAVGALSELIRAVDHLPSRDEAMRVVISALLAQKGQFAAAMAGGISLNRAQGLLSLVSVISLSEPYLLARGGQEADEVLQWLVIGMGGVLGLAGASVAAEAWPRVLSVPKPKRSSLLQSPFFASGAQAILQAATYPSSFHTWVDSPIEKEDFLIFREGLAKDAFVSCFNELGLALLAYIIEQFRAAKRWQDAEVCLYAAVALEEDLPSEHSSFFFSLLEGLPARSAVTERDFGSLPHLRLVETATTLLEAYADLAASDPTALELSLGYALGALHIPEVRPAAATAFKELCRGGAESLAAAGTLPALMTACEHAILKSNDLLAVIEGLTQVAAALPLEAAKAALISLTSSATVTIKALAGAPNGENGPVLAEALRVVAVAVGGGGASAAAVLHEISDAVSVASSVWTENGDVSSAVRELRSVADVRVGALQHLRPG